MKPPARVRRWMDRRSFRVLADTLPRLNQSSRERRQQLKNFILDSEIAWLRRGLLISPTYRYGSLSHGALAITGAAIVGKTTLARMVERIVTDYNEMVQQYQPDEKTSNLPGIVFVRFTTDRPMRAVEEIVGSQHYHITADEMDWLWAGGTQSESLPTNLRPVIGIKLPRGYRYILTFKEYHSALTAGLPILLDLSSPEIAVGLKSALPVHVHHTFAHWNGDIWGTSSIPRTRPEWQQDEHEARRRYEVAVGSWILERIVKSPSELDIVAHSQSYYPIVQDEANIKQAVFTVAQHLIEILYAMESRDLRHDCCVPEAIRWAFVEFQSQKQAVLDLIEEHREEIIEKAGDSKWSATVPSPMANLWYEYLAAYGNEGYHYFSPLWSYQSS